MIGQMLAHYRVTERIGAGGMGEVWKAVDTSLNRDVAIKLLPESFSENADRVSRFEREARLLATLNHPGIAAIHGLHEADGKRFLAMELVPGTDLAQRIDQGPIPVDTAIELATQLAAALEAAHEKGIVHRDLKPANIMLTDDDTVKVLDFGLAKIEEGGDSSSSLSQSPTMGSSPTVAGVILGTAAYMSPEQARGRKVDKRTDVWAFGCVLYEMLTGQAVFSGETPADTIGAVLHKEPNWTLLPAHTPSSVRMLLKRCLEKDKRRRLRDVGDALLFIDEDATADLTEGIAPAGKRPVWPIALGAVAAGLLIGVLAANMLRPSAPEPETRKFVTPVKGLGMRLGGAIFPAPDGKSVLYAKDGELVIRELDSTTPRVIETPQNTSRSIVAWSPDSRWFAYDAEKRMWKIPVEGGESIEICDIPETGQVIGSSWGADGRIAFTVWRGGMYSVPAAGGTAELLLDVDHETIVDYHRVEHLPDGSLMFDVHWAGRSMGDYSHALRLSDGNIDTLARGATGPTWSPTGHLLYTQWNERGPTVLGVPFSLDARQPTGDPFVIQRDAVGPTVTDNGLLFYGSLAARGTTELVSIDREGNVDALGGPWESATGVALSPDGRSVALDLWIDGEEAIWVFDLARGTQRRLTFDAEYNLGWPSWSADGREILFSRTRNLRSTLSRIAADGSSTEEELFEGHRARFAPGMGHMSYVLHKLDGDYDQWAAALDSEGRITAQAERSPVAATERAEDEGQLSPDGRYLAFEHGEDEGREILLTQFPSGEGRWQVSHGAARMPCWSRDGRSVFYFDDEGVMWEVPVDTRSGVDLGTPRRVFDADEIDVELRRGYDVLADGRFLAIREVAPEDVEAQYQIVIVDNWLAEFRETP